MKKQVKHTRGMALVFVLWIVLLLTAIAFQMTYRGHLRSLVTATTGDMNKAHYLARAGVEMAIADLADNYETVVDQHDLRRDSERNYKNRELGGGSYTLYAGMDENHSMSFGLMDESAKLNIHNVGLKVLEKMVFLENGMASAIIELRKEEEFFDLNTLLLIEGVDALKLYGEDQNGNGLLDDFEDDGEQNWPPDNGDGVLDRGMSAYLTSWSAAHDVTAEGLARIDLNDAEAKEISEASVDISTQQADSIVHHRDNNELTSPLGLLDVKLMNKVKKKDDKKKQNTSRSREGTGGESSDNGPNPDDKGDEGKKETSEFEYQDTGKKAFTREEVLKIADLFTIQDEVIVRGLININTASAEVLACLPGIDEAVARAIEGEAESRPDGFVKVTDLLDIQGIEMDVLKQFYTRVSVRSDVYTVRSFGVLNNMTTIACVSAVLERGEDEVVIRYWREHD